MKDYRAITGLQNERGKNKEPEGKKHTPNIPRGPGLSRRLVCAATFMIVEYMWG